MYSVDDPPGLASDALEEMTWALTEATQAGDWGLTESLQHAIFAMKGGKGGFRKGGLGKGSPARAVPRWRPRPKARAPGPSGPKAPATLALIHI